MRLSLPLLSIMVAIIAGGAFAVVILHATTTVAYSTNTVASEPLPLVPDTQPFTSLDTETELPPPPAPPTTTETLSVPKLIEVLTGILKLQQDSLLLVQGTLNERGSTQRVSTAAGSDYVLRAQVDRVYDNIGRSVSNVTNGGSFSSPSLSSPSLTNSTLTNLTASGQTTLNDPLT